MDECDHVGYRQVLSLFEHFLDVATVDIPMMLDGD